MERDICEEDDLIFIGFWQNTYVYISKSDLDWLYIEEREKGQETKKLKWSVGLISIKFEDIKDFTMQVDCFYLENCKSLH